MPSPNHSRNNGASTTRGTAFSILMYGSKMLASIGDRPSEKPAEMPITAPTTRPSSDSSSVTARCPHSDPVETHCTIRCAMSDGRLTKKASSTFSETSVCQSVSATAPTATRQNRTAGPVGSAPGTAGAASATRLPRWLLALDDFLAKHRPDRAIEVDERRRRAQLHQVARTIEDRKSTRLNSSHPSI